VASFLIPARPDPLLSINSVASFFKKLSAFSHQPSAFRSSERPVGWPQATFFLPPSADCLLAPWPNPFAARWFCPFASLSTHDFCHLLLHFCLLPFAFCLSLLFLPTVL